MSDGAPKRRRSSLEHRNRRPTVEDFMSEQLRYVAELAERARERSAFPTNWELLSPGRRYPPALEDWLRESRERLLKRYGGVVGRQLGRSRMGR